MDQGSFGAPIPHSGSPENQHSGQAGGDSSHRLDPEVDAFRVPDAEDSGS